MKRQGITLISIALSLLVLTGCEAGGVAPAGSAAPSAATPAGSARSRQGRPELDAKLVKDAGLDRMCSFPGRCFAAPEDACADIACPKERCGSTAALPGHVFCQDERDPRAVGTQPRVLFQDDRRQIVEGTSCGGFGEAVDVRANPPRQEGTRWVRREEFSCGCPVHLAKDKRAGDDRRRKFTLVIEPGSNPVKARLCRDDAADPCQSLCGEDLAWDLTEVLKRHGAASVAFVQ